MEGLGIVKRKYSGYNTSSCKRMEKCFKEKKRLYNKLLSAKDKKTNKNIKVRKLTVMEKMMHVMKPAGMQNNIQEGQEVQESYKGCEKNAKTYSIYAITKHYRNTITKCC